MKIILRNPLPWGNYATQVIEIANDLQIKDFKKLICDRFKLNPSRSMIKFERDDFIIRICDNFPLKFYEIEEKTIFYVEKIESKAEDLNNSHTNYLSKLGLLSTIKEEETYSFDSKRIPTLESVQFDLMDYEVEESLNMSSHSKLERFLDEIKGGNLEMIKQFLKDNSGEDHEGRNIVRSEGIGGWAALHYAVFCGWNDIVKFLLENNADINQATIDEWTPLQLAIQRNHMDTLKLLLDDKNIKINEITSRSSALHIAASLNNKEMVLLLLAYGADSSLKDLNETCIVELATDHEIQKIIEEDIHNKIILENERNHKAFQPDAPLITEGYLFKTGPTLFNIKLRFFVLNPQEGTFIRYPSKEDYPDKPLEIIMLKDIISVKRINPPWFLNKDYYYFEIIHSSRQVFCAHFELTAISWVTSIYKSCVFSLFSSPKLSIRSSSPSLSPNLKQTKSVEMNNFNKEEIGNLKLERYESKKSFISNSNDNVNSSLNNNNNNNNNINNNNISNNNNIINNNNNNNNYNSSNRVEILDEEITEKPKNYPFNYDLTEEMVKSHEKFKHEHEETPMTILENVDEQKIGFNSFHIVKLLGQGTFGKVFLVRNKKDGKIYAMKALKKKNLIAKKQLRYAIGEANVLKRSNHPFILGLHYSFQTLVNLYLVIDYCPGGDLSLHLAQRFKFTEAMAKFYIAEALLGLERLHDLDIVYRDLKPENILICNDGHIKLADFGLSKENIGDKDATKSFCGSPAYLAPEVIMNQGAGKAADIYALGAVLYEMLVGEPPFYNEDIPKLYKNVKEGKLTFPNDISKEAKSLLTGLLNRDPRERLGVNNRKEIRKHQFFKGIDWRKLLNKEYIPPIYIDLNEKEKKLKAKDHSKKVNFQDVDYDSTNWKINRVINFSFSKNNNIDA